MILTEEDRLARALRLDDECFALFEAGDYAAAEGHCREALALFEELDGPVHPDGANMLQRLAAILDRLGRYRDAENCAARAVAIMDEIAALVEGPEAGLILIESLVQWGTALRQQGRYREAEPLLRRAIEQAEQHPDRDVLVSALNALGVLAKYSAQFDEGERVYRRALAIALDLHPERHPMVATLYHNLGGLDHARGNFAAAEAPARRAWEIRRELLGPDHPETGADACAYAGVLDGLERYTESRPIYQHALEIFERLYGSEHFEIAATLNNLSSVDAAEGDLETARLRCRRALQLKEKLLGPDHPECALTSRLLASMS